MSEKYLRIRYVKSMIGAKERHKRTVRALGLRRLGDEVVKKADPAVLGMVRAVAHLVEVEEVEAPEAE